MLNWQFGVAVDAEGLFHDQGAAHRRFDFFDAQLASGATAPGEAAVAVHAGELARCPVRLAGLHPSAMRARSIRCGKSMFHSCGGTYGHPVMKHMSQSVQASTTTGEGFRLHLVELAGRRGVDQVEEAEKLSHRLKQRRQVTEVEAAQPSSSLAGSRNRAPPPRSGWRVGALRLPSRMESTPEQRASARLARQCRPGR